MTDHDENIDETTHDTPAAADDQSMATQFRDIDGPAIPWRLALFLLILVALVVFAVQNTQDVQLQFLGWAGEYPLILIIAGVAVTTIILDQILGGIVRRSRRNRRAEKQELKRLRNQG